MSRREPCLYFLRGSCRFCNNCRWLHVSTNEYLFDLGEKNKNSTSQFQALSKPFANKWIRSTSTAPNLTDSQTPGSSHICTDPESCQNIIADYFKNAMPCDISFEELRAMAYEEAKNGCTLEHIDSKERNLMQSELSEFDNDEALRTPPSYAVSDNTPDQGKNAPKANIVRIKIADTALMNIDKFDLGTGSPLKTGGSCGQCDAAPAFTSFTQLGTAANVTSAFREKQEDSKEDGIWLKENWSIGEVCIFKKCRCSQPTKKLPPPSKNLLS
ncbi:zinc finger CCCH domain-containing protein 16-like [Carex rostrata]